MPVILWGMILKKAAAISNIAVMTIEVLSRLVAIRNVQKGIARINPIGPQLLNRMISCCVMLENGELGWVVLKSDITGAIGGQVFQNKHY